MHLDQPGNSSLERGNNLTLKNCVTGEIDTTWETQTHTRSVAHTQMRRQPANKIQVRSQHNRQQIQVHNSNLETNKPGSKISSAKHVPDLETGNRGTGIQVPRFANKILAIVFSASRPALFLGHPPKLVFSAFAVPLPLCSLAVGKSR